MYFIGGVRFNNHESPEKELESMQTLQRTIHESHDKVEDALQDSLEDLRVLVDLKEAVGDVNEAFHALYLANNVAELKKILGDLTDKLSDYDMDEVFSDGE